MEAPKILVVDDESRMRKLVKDFLEKKNFHVLEAGDGEEAMDVDVTVTTGDDSNDTYVTLTKIDGQWYVYDAMYYFATACYGTSQGGM